MNVFIYEKGLSFFPVLNFATIIKALLVFLILRLLQIFIKGSDKAGWHCSLVLTNLIGWH